MIKKTKNKLNKFTEEKNNQPEEAIIIGEETELPETKSIIPIKEFAMPIATPEQLKRGMELYQQCVNALIKEGDVVMIENKPHGKKIAINKINSVFGVSTEVIKSFQEEQIANKDYWSKGFQKVILVHKGEKYLVAKAWVKAILPNGQFATRGGAVSETERRFAHTPHDLIATAETRAMKNAAINLLGVEFEMVEDKDNGIEAEKTEPKKWAVDDNKGKIYKPKPNQEQGYKHSAVTRPELPASQKQIDYINVLIERLKKNYEIETELEKPVEELKKGEAANLITKLLFKGKGATKNIRKEIPMGEPSSNAEPPQEDGTIYGKEKEIKEIFGGQENK